MTNLERFWLDLIDGRKYHIQTLYGTEAMQRYRPHPRENERQQYERETAEALRYITPEFGTEFNPIAARVNRPEWLKGEDRLTYTEREEMRERDKNRAK
jgi:hypothetical protein